MLKYKTILIDPPWPVKFIKLEMRPNQISMPYKTMTIDEITNLPIGNLADNDCSLFCWTTHTFLPYSFDIIKSWGFKYHCLLTWNKGNGRPHMGFKRMTEFVIYGYKGKINVNQKGIYIKTLIREIPDIFNEKLTSHSAKPILFYKILEHNTPEPRIELFARHKRAGWHAWGNEFKSDIELKVVEKGSFRDKSLTKPTNQRKKMI